MINTMETIQLNIAREFTDTPGPRKRTEGDHSGEEFLEVLLQPRFLKATEQRVKLQVDLDGAVGYPSSFLEEAFGGLARKCGIQKVLNSIEIICNDEPYLAEQIVRYIQRANQK